MRPSQLLTAVLTLSSFTAAWPFGNLKAVQGIEDMLYGRQDSKSSAASVISSDSSAETSTPEPSAAATTAAETAAASSTNRVSSGGSATASGSRQTTARPTATQTGARNSSATTDFDPRLPAGGVSMVTPAAISGPQYYKIGDWVTLGWNYTSVSVLPSAIDVLASCRANQQTYTLALNQTVDRAGNELLWDTGAYQATATVPLLTETYTLIIYDAQSSISAAPRPGYLGVFNQWTFGMYEPRKYQSIADGWKCASCSGAMSSMERQTLSFLFGMAAITVLSFTWFAGGVGLF